MPQVHLITGKRTCGASTVQGGNTNVYINGKLVAVDGDKNDHGSGDLQASGAGKVWIRGKKLVVRGDPAQTDDQGHGNPSAADGSSNVYAGG